MVGSCLVGMVDSAGPASLIDFRFHPMKAAVVGVGFASPVHLVVHLVHPGIYDDDDGVVHLHLPLE